MLRPGMVAGVSAVLLGCGPDIVDLSNVYPRNCGVQGPVDLLEIDPVPWLSVHPAGEHYLIELTSEDGDVAWWMVDRCAQSRVQLDPGSLSPTVSIGAGGDYILACDEGTGAMHVIDPTGVRPHRLLFEAVAGCRVVPLDGGLAVQEKDDGSVWFHPDPSDPSVEPIIVTDRARLSDANWDYCFDGFDCEPRHPFGIDIRAAGDELLVVLDDAQLLGFSARTGETRIIDPGPVRALDVLGEGESLVIDHKLGPTFVVDRRTGSRFEFCCYSDLNRISRFDEWVVRGNGGNPTIPASSSWTNFRARHLPSGRSYEIEGDEAWHPLGRIDPESFLVDIRPDFPPYSGLEYERYVVWPATQERDEIEMPGDVVWSIPGRDGVYALDRSEAASALRFLAEPGRDPTILAEDVDVAFATRHGRIVFTDRRVEPGQTSRLGVLLPDHRQVELEAAALDVIEALDWQWPVERDEVVYTVPERDRIIIRRTVLP